MQILITGGGTGGHIYPALAIAAAYGKKHPNAKICFAGTPWGLEAELIPRAGYPFHPLPIRGLKRSLSLSNCKALWLLLHSFARADRILRMVQPDLVIGTGGYVCYPLVRAAQRAGIPTLLHESNAVPGLAIRRLAGRSSLVFTNFAKTADRLPALPKERICCVGNPLRADFTAADRNTARNRLGITGRYRKLVVAVGGSLGAERLNDAVARTVSVLAPKHPDWLFWHAAGKRDHDRIHALYRSLLPPGCSNGAVFAYFDDLPLRMSAADLLISRAGAMTLSELSALGKPSVLVPSPYVAQDHQRKNAVVFEEAGAAVLWDELRSEWESLCHTVEATLSDAPLLYRMGAAAKRFAHVDAAAAICEKADQILHL